jgi:hypothetical protein
MNKKDEQIEQKLIELEARVVDEEKTSVSAPKSASTGMTVTNNSNLEPQVDVGRDLQFFAGLGLIFTGILMLFNHVRVGTGFFAMMGLGGGGFGLLMIPLLVGIGWAFYDSKSKWGWTIISATIGLIFFSILSSLVMSFPGISLLGLIMMLAPLAFGGALLLKSMGGPKGVQQKMREERLIK